MDELRPPTQATIIAISGFDWFSLVGSRNPNVTTAIVLDNWYEAIASAEAVEWENLGLDAANGYREQLCAVAPSRFSTWNEKVEAIKRITQPLISDVFFRKPGLAALPRVIRDSTEWDILHVCLEAEFSDCLPLGYYASMSYWYSVGHFPCGWRGQFPDGRLVIY